MPVLRTAAGVQRSRRPGPLPDVLAPGMRVVFVGINPSITSGAVGHHFASKGNPFWRLLHASGLTPVPLEPADDAKLAELGLGLTNLCPRPTRTAAELTRAELEAGAAELLRKLGAKDIPCPNLCPNLIPEEALPRKEGAR